MQRKKSEMFLKDTKVLSFMFGIEKLSVEYNDADLMCGVRSGRSLSFNKRIKQGDMFAIRFGFGAKKIIYRGNSYSVCNGSYAALNHLIGENFSELEEETRMRVASGQDVHVQLEKLLYRAGEFIDKNNIETQNIGFFSLLDLRWKFFLKAVMLLIVVRKVGVQHGGAYALFKNNKIENAEIASFDDFIYWDVIDDKCKQCMRYDNLPDLSLFRGSVVPHLAPKKQWAEFNYGLFCHLETNNTYDKLFSFSKEKRYTFLHHPRRKAKLSLIEKPYALVPNIFKISKSKTNYFSYLGSTMLEYAMAYDRPYKLLLENMPKEEHLSAYGSRFVDFLEERNKIEFI